MRAQPKAGFISGREIHISESVAGLIGQNDTEIQCTFILEEGDAISSVSILAENLTDNQFQPIAAFVQDQIVFLLPFGKILFEHYTVEKTEKELLLVFDDLRCKHGRQYRCSLTVFPKQSVYTTELCSAIMVISAQVKVKDPVITVYPDELMYEIGELIKLQCKASGDPAPTYTWIKDSISNETLTSNNTFVIQEANISDSGLYTCLVNNSINDIVYSAEGSKYIEIVLITVTSSSIMLIVATGCIIICHLKNSQGNKYLDTVRPQNQTLAKPDILAYEYASASFEGLEESRVTLEASNTFKHQIEKYKNDKHSAAISASVSDKETMIKSKTGDIRESLENHYASPVPEIYDKLDDRRHKPNIAEKFDTIVELKHLSEDKCVIDENSTDHLEQQSAFSD
ncbi:unnamed protein product [Mytilus coruscus]|uniref:Ig-like domain-containing protein n=1 Tax=Mytilus coruscus TaxID=42192 RepID=A0A6J8CTR9_MYTCO|nr:unnamed protein product [Mytilus coruscus]